MFTSTLRNTMVAGLAAAAMLAVPAESRACSFLCNLFGCRSCAARPMMAAPGVAPTYAAPACGGGCTSCPQTVQYLPQVSYRTIVQRVPVTACQATTACDPCTGGTVTAYRPVVSWVQQTQLVPYTTYRIVYSNALTPYASYQPVGCGPCGGASMGYSAAPGGCSSCASGAGTYSSQSPMPTYSTPATSPTENSPAPSSANVSPPSAMYPNGSPPITVPGPTTPTPKTFEPTPPTSTPDTRLRPIPDAKTDSTSTPKLIDPDARTTSLPVRQAVFYKMISSPERQDDGGWRASSR